MQARPVSAARDFRADATLLRNREDRSSVVFHRRAEYNAYPAVRGILQNGSCSALRRTARFASTACEWRHEVLSTVWRSLGIQRTIPVRPRDDARVGLRECRMPSQAISCPAGGCAANPLGEGSHPDGQGRRGPRVRHRHQSEGAHRQEPEAKRSVTLRRPL